MPDEEFIRHWARNKGRRADLAELAEDPDFQRSLAPVIERVNDKLSNLEKIRRFTLSPAAFTVDNGLMTPTLKIRRHKIKERYGERLENLY